jgi:hypothetical protein
MKDSHNLTCDKIAEFKEKGVSRWWVLLLAGSFLFSGCINSPLEIQIVGKKPNGKRERPTVTLNEK